MEKNEKLAKQLNDLVEINNDRIAGYEKAAAEAKDTDLQSQFREMASHSRNYKKDLATHVQNFGGQPTEGTRTSGKFFRAWMDIKAAITGNKRSEILKSCITGEDAAVEAYDDVLKAEVTLPDDIRKVIDSQKMEIQKDREKIIKLKDLVEVK